MKEFLSKMKQSFKHHWGQFIKEGQECVKEFKSLETRKKQIPNLLTASRLFAPIFIIPAAISGNLPLTAFFVAGFSLTDAADGYFARKYNATSEFGRKLDALTDKLFAASLLVPLIVVNPALLTVLTMEGVISGINVYSQLSDNAPKTEFIGKVKTAALSGTIGLNYIALLTKVHPIFLNIAMYSTVALQMLTSAKYLAVLTNEERAKEKKNPDESIVIEQPTESTGDNVKVLELGEATPMTHTTDNIVDITPLLPPRNLSAGEQARQLREMRYQLTYQEPAEEDVQKKIGTKI